MKELNKNILIMVVYIILLKQLEKKSPLVRTISVEATLALNSFGVQQWHKSKDRPQTFPICKRKIGTSTSLLSHHTAATP
jgi:hypothetical protein